jgi:hypothetical protein
MALRYYKGAPRGDEVEGLSKVQSLDVADMIEALLSFMVPSLTSQSLVQFASLGADDEEQAARESRVIQALFRQGTSNSYVAIQEAAKDAMLLRNGILKVWIETRQEIERETYTLPGDKDTPDLAALGETLRQAADQPNMTAELSGIKRLKKEAGAWSWECTIKTTETNKRLRLAAVDPCNFFVAADAAGMELDDIRFCAERQLPTRSDLIDEGIAAEVVADLPAWTGTARMDSFERKRGRNSAQRAEDFWSQSVEVYRCYMMLGTGESGRGERWCVSLAAGQRMIKRERCEYVPYGVGSVILAGHQFQGISIFDRLKETQDTKTGFLREWLNNSQFVNKPRAALLDGQVNEDDFYDVRVGGGVKVLSRDAVQWLVTPDIGPSCQEGLNYQDKIRSERAGASLEMLKPGLQLNSPTAAGTEREMSVKEQLAALFAANLAQTLLRGIYLAAHRCIREGMGERVEAQSAGEWIQEDPSKWREREDVSIVIGLSPGERQRRLMALQAVIGEQEKALLNGLEGEITTRGQLHASLTEWTRAAGLDAPERYWTDPESDAAKKVRLGKEEQQRTLGKAQADLLTRVKILESQVDIYKTQIQEAGKYWAEVIRAEVEEMKVVGHSTAQLEAAKIGAAQRSGALSGAANETAAAAGANAAKEVPQAGQLPPGAIN